MLSLKELNPHNYDTTDEINENLLTLLHRVNVVRIRWGKLMTVTSGLRSDSDQERLIQEGKSNAVKSKHLTGQAVDIADDGSLYTWLHDKPDVLETAKLWCELGTKGWVHFQTVPPGSGNRWFLP